MSFLLDVPYKEKEEVKALRATWDPKLKLWRLNEKKEYKVKKKSWFTYCYKHRDQKAVAVCSRCGKKLCSECSSKIYPPLCEECIHQTFRQLCYDIIIRQCVLSAVGITLFFISFFLLDTSFIQNIYNYHSIIDRTIISVMFAGMPFGWNLLSKYTSKSGVQFSTIGWCFYIVLKLIVSWAIGIFTVIINLGKIIRKAIQELAATKKITLYHLILD